MATYPQGITSFIPSYQPFQLDWNVLSRNLQLKQTKYDQNWNQINNVYSRLYEAQVSNPESQKVKDNLLKEIDFNVRRITGLDLSLKQNVAQAEQVFKPFYQNANFVADIVKTSQYNTEMSKGKGFATSKNKAEQDMYWGGGLQYLQNKMDEFKSLPFNELSGFENFQYVPYVDTDKVMREIQKEMGNVKVMQRNGSYWVTTQNGELLKEPLQDRFRQALASDPRVMDVYRVEAYNAGEANIKNKMSQDANLNREAAEKLYINEELQPLIEAQQRRLEKTISDKEVVQKKIDSLKLKSKNNATPEVDSALVQYEKYLSDLQQLEDINTANLESLKGNATSTGNTEGGSGIDPNDLDRLRYGIDLNVAGKFLESDILSTAEAMSIANFEQTYKVDDIAKIAYTKNAELMNYQKKKFIDAAAKAGMFPYLSTNEKGDPRYFEWADENKREEKEIAKKKLDAEIKKGLETGSYVPDENGIPRLNEKKHAVQSMNVQGATPGDVNRADQEALMDQNVANAKAEVVEGLGDLLTVMDQMLDNGTASPDEVHSILGSFQDVGSAEYVNYQKVKEMYDSGEIRNQEAYELLRALNQSTYQTQIEKEAGVDLTTSTDISNQSNTSEVQKRIQKLKEKNEAEYPWRGGVNQAGMPFYDEAGLLIGTDANAQTQSMRKQFYDMSDEEKLAYVKQQLKPSLTPLFGETKVNPQGVFLAGIAEKISDSQGYMSVGLENNLIDGKETGDFTNKKQEDFINFDLGLILDNYKTFVQENNALMSDEQKAKNIKIYNLVSDFEDYKDVAYQTYLANVKRTQEEQALLKDYALKVGGNMADRVSLLKEFDPDLGKWRDVTFEEYARKVKNVYSPQEMVPTNNLTLTGMAQDFMKGWGPVAAGTAWMHAASPATLGAPTIISQATAVGAGLVTMLVPAIFDGAEDLANTFYYKDDGEIFIHGMNREREMNAFYGAEDLITLKGRGNNLRHEYNAYMAELQRIYKDQEIKTPIPGVRTFIDAKTKGSGVGDLTVSTPAIEVDPDIPTAMPTKMFLSELQPILRSLEVKANQAGNDLNDVSVYGVSQADFEKTTDEFGGDEVADLANLIITDLTDYPSKNDGYKVKEFKIGVSPLSKDSAKEGAIIIWPNESFLDQKLKILFPEADQKTKRENLKAQVLQQSQGLAISVPVDVVKNTELYKSQSMSTIVQAINNDSRGYRDYYSSEPGYMLRFTPIGIGSENSMQVTHYFPVYDIVTGEQTIQENIVEKAVLGRNVHDYKNHFMTEVVPAYARQNAARYQQYKAQSKAE